MLYFNKPFKRAVLRDRKGDLQKEWYVEFYVWDEESSKLVRKRIKISKSILSKKGRIEEANRIISETNALLEQGFYIKANPTDENSDIINENNSDFVGCLEHTLNIISPTLRPKTIITYRSAINKVKDYQGDLNLSIFNISERWVVRFRDHLLITLKNTARTANNTISYLAVLYSHLNSRAELDTNPFKIKRLSQTTTEKNVAFTRDDQYKIERYLEKNDLPLYLLTRFIYYAFIRPGELNRIKISAIDIENNSIVIPGSISKNKKTENVPMIPPLVELVRGMALNCEKTKFLFGRELSPSYGMSGKAVAFRRHKKALENVGLGNKKYTLYSWKHTGAVNAYLSGVGLKELQALLRHSSVQITDIYLKSLGLRTDPNLKNYNW